MELNSVCVCVCACLSCPAPRTYRIFNFLVLPVEYFICSLNALTTALSWLKEHHLATPSEAFWIHSAGSSNYMSLGQSHR